MNSPDKPLSGRRILITRHESQALPVMERIERLGGTADCVPLLTFRVSQDQKPIERTLKKLDSYEWIIFTSQNAVRYFMEILKRFNMSVQALKKHRIAVIGEKTEKLLRELDLTVHFKPTEYVAERFVEQFSSVMSDEEKALLPHGNLARDMIPVGLKQTGKQVDPVVIYETVPNDIQASNLVDLLQQGRIDFVTFTSSSTVDFFFTYVRKEGVDLNKVQFACIGPITARTLETYGHNAAIIADVYTMEGLLESIVKKVREEEK